MLISPLCGRLLRRRRVTHTPTFTFFVCALSSLSVKAKVGGAVDRFGDYLYVDRAHLLCMGQHNQFTDTKFTRPTKKISKSSKSFP